MCRVRAFTIDAMRPAKPWKFYGFFGTWAVVVALGLLVPGVPPGGSEPPLVILFWALLAGCLGGSWALWPRVWRLYSQPVQFRPADGAEVQRLPMPGVPVGTLFVTLCCSLGAVLLLGGLPLSKTVRLAAGLRGRTVALPQSAPAPEDFQTADIYLLPLNRFPAGAAAYLAAELRRETGLKIAALPAYEVPGVEFNPRRRQVVAESMEPGLKKRIDGMKLPPPPRPHPPLVVSLFDEDTYVRGADWRFVLTNSFNRVSGVVCTYRLRVDLPLDDAKAQRLLAERTKKLILRLIAFHCFSVERSDDPRSLTGATLRGNQDLDSREDHLRIALPSSAPRR